METIKKLVNIGYISYKFTMNNRKATFTTLIGIIISLTIIISSSMLIESYRGELINEFLFIDRNEWRGEIQIDLYPNAFTNETDWIRSEDYYEELVTETFEELNYHRYFRKQHWYHSFKLGYWNDSANYGGVFEHYNFIDLNTIRTLNLIEPYLDIEDAIPQNYTEIIAVTKANGSKIELGQDLEVSIPPGNVGPGRFRSLNIKVVGVIEYEKLEHYLLESLLTQKLSNDFLMITSPEYAFDLIDQLKGSSDRVFVSHVVGKIFLDPMQIDIYDLPRERIKYNVLLTELNNQLTTSQNEIAISDTYDLDFKIKSAENTLQILKILVFLIDIPVIVISFYLISYSYNLIKRQKIETIGTIKTRGASSQQIFTLLSVEVLVSVIVAIISALFLGFGLVGILLRSSNFLDFSGSFIPIIISFSAIQNIIISSFVIITVLNLSSIIRYSKMTIFESIQPIEKRIPIWKRYYLDVIASVTGLAGYFIINEIGNLSTGFDNEPLLPLIFLLLGVPAPFLLFIGSILVIARIFPIMIEILAKHMWKSRGMLVAFAFRNIVRHKQTATRTVILITLALSYVIISASLAFSIDESKKMETYYTTGADLRLGLPYLNDSTIKFVENNITGVNRITQTIFGYVPSAHGIHYYTFCFVDPRSFSETAFFDAKVFDISEPLPSLMNKISDNKSILLYKPNFEGKPKLKINDSFSFSFENETHEDLLNYTIAGSFKHWPQFFPYPWLPDDYYFVIGSLGMFNDLITPEYISISRINYLIDLEDDFDIGSVIDKIWEYADFPVESASITYQNYLESVERRFGLSILNTSLISCIIVSIIGVFMFTIFTYLERAKERGVERALGMTQLQTALLFMIEGLTILFFGLIIGVSTGILNTAFFLFVTQLGRSIPPIVIAYPFEFILSFIIFIAIIAIVSTLIIAYLSTKRDISRVLKVE